MLYDLLKDGVKYGESCLTSEDAAELNVVSPELVLREFKKLSWPAAELVVEPPNGETLVNLDTNFYTTTTDSATQTVTLLGQRVQIEATPSSYTWHFDSGQDDSSMQTASPGTPYPDLTVTHRYLTASVTVHPSVDVTYSGRFRVGNGPWTEIPGTHTVAGGSVSLRVVEAQPVLVGPRSR